MNKKIVYFVLPALAVVLALSRTWAEFKRRRPSS